MNRIRGLVAPGLLGALLLLPGLLPWSQAGTAEAQTEADSSYTITVEDRTDEHPWTGRENAFEEVFVVDGIQGDTIFVERGKTYEFVMDEVPEFHPFYLSESEVGVEEEVYTQGVTSTNEEHDDRAWGTQTLTFEPTEQTPDTLYYQCTNHRYMGGTIVVGSETATDAPSRQRAGELPERFRIEGNYPNPFNPVTTIRFDLPRAARVTIQIYDVLGKRVRTMDVGTVSAGSGRKIRVDAADLPTGVYLYRVAARTGSDVWTGAGTMSLVK